MKDRLRQVLPVLAVAFLLRIAAAFATTVTVLNPASRNDAVKFAQTAATISRDFPAAIASLLEPGPAGIYQLWGTFLAPFWMLPGPSGFYARVANCLLGTLAIYNVYLIGRHYHSHRAGLLAALPMVFYPSFLAVHSTLLREAIILFGLTTVVRVLILRPTDGLRWHSYLLLLCVFYAAYIQRPDNGIIYLAAIVCGIVGYTFRTGILSRRVLGTLAAVSPLAFILSLPLLRDIVNSLARIRTARTHGRAVYLPETIPRTVGELIAFSWIGAAYFLYTPFPWMIDTIPGVLIGTEGILNIGFTVAALLGVQVSVRRDAPTVAALVAGFLIAVVLYGVGTGNYGAAMRHRQMFLWVVFLFGGIGIVEKFRFTGLPGRNRTNSQVS